MGAESNWCWDQYICTDRVAALIAWMLVVRVGDLVKDGAKRRHLRRSTILDKITNTNRVPSKRSRPLSAPSHNARRADRGDYTWTPNSSATCSPNSAR